MSDLLFIDNNRDKIKLINLGGSPAEYRIKEYQDSSDFEKDSGAYKIRSAVEYKGKLLLAGDFGVVYQKDGVWVDYITFSGGGDRYKNTGWLMNAVYQLAVNNSGNNLVILGNFENAQLSSDSNPVSCKNFIVVQENDGVLSLPYSNIKDISKNLPLIKANVFPLTSTDVSNNIFADDNIVSIYFYDDNVWILDKGIYSFKDIDINDYGIIDSNISLTEPVENLYKINLTTNTLNKYIVRGEVLSDTLIENNNTAKVYITSGVNKEVNSIKYNQTLFYILDLSANQFISDQVHNQKIIKSVPINDNQFYFVSSQPTAGVSSTDVENNPNFITAIRNNRAGESFQTNDTFFGSGKRSEPLKTNGLQEVDNIFSTLTSKIKGVMTLTLNMRWKVINSNPGNLKIIVKKNDEQFSVIPFDLNDTTKVVTIPVLAEDKISFLVDDIYYERFVMDFEAYVDNVNTFYAKDLSFARHLSNVNFIKIHNGIKINNDAKQNSAVLLDDNNNVWFLKPETLDYMIDLRDSVEYGGRLVKYTLPSNINPADVVLGDDVIAVLSTDGNIYTWGKNTLGQLGASLAENSIVDQVPVKVDGNNYVSIYVCNNTLYAIDEDNNMHAWGSNIIFGYQPDNTRIKLSTGLIPNLDADFTNTPQQIFITLGLRNTPENRACGQISAANRSLVGKKWSSVSIGPTDVYAIDQLGLMYYWGDYEEKGSLFSFDYSKSNLRPRLNKGLPVFIGAPGYTINYASDVELTNSYQADNNYYYTSKLSDYVLNNNSINSTVSEDIEPFENRAIDFIQLKNNQYKISLEIDDTDLYFSDMIVKNVKKGDTILRIKIQDKTLSSITDESGASVNAAYRSIKAKYDGLVIINPSYLSKLSGTNLKDSTYENLFIFYYNVYTENFNTSNPGTYNRVIHDSYIFKNPYSDTVTNVSPIPYSYTRTSNLTHQTSSVVYYESTGGSFIWSKNALDKDAKNSSEAINSIVKYDLFSGYNPNTIFNHEYLKFTSDKPQILSSSLYHNYLNLSDTSDIQIRFRIIDQTLGTRIFTLCKENTDGTYDCAEADTSRKTHDTLSSAGNTNIRITTLNNSALKIDSNIAFNRNIFTESKLITSNNNEYALSTDGKIYVLPAGANSQGVSKYNYAYVLNDPVLFNIDNSTPPNFVNSSAIVTSLVLYRNYIIVGGNFPDGNSQINLDNKFVIWDHYESRVLQPSGD